MSALILLPGMWITVLGRVIPLDVAVRSANSSQDTVMLDGLWPRSGEGELVYVLRASDL